MDKSSRESIESGGNIFWLDNIRKPQLLTKYISAGEKLDFF